MSKKVDFWPITHIKLAVAMETSKMMIDTQLTY